MSALSNGKDHAHIVTRGSMKLAHNLDDRQERASLRTDDSDRENAKVVDPTHVAKKFKNLGWLSQRSTTK